MGSMVHICRHLVHRTAVVSTFVRLQANKYMYSSVASYPALVSIPKFLPLSGGVIVSSCHDVYANLAFEDWVYENCARYADCDQLDLMFLWRNHPCVVIGRHQNVWAECNVDNVLADGVNIARRRSGGGTVYHDSGNLNITFITGRKNYNRKGNLAMIASMLQQCSLDVQVSKRDDIMLHDKYKISGTAAKLGSKVAYHHCTLLLNAKLQSIKNYLRGMPGISSKATASVRMPVANISDYNSSFDYDRCLQMLTDVYCSQKPNCQVGYSHIDPTNDAVFSGIHQLRTELMKWDWIYGHTPKFSISRTFACHVAGENAQIQVDAEVDKGRIRSITVDVNGCHSELLQFVLNFCHMLSTALTNEQLWTSQLKNHIQQTAAIQRHHESTELMTLWVKCITDCVVNFFTGT